MVAAAYAFDPSAFDGGEHYTPAYPLRDDSFTAQQPTGIRWLNVHPLSLVSEDAWEIVRLAREREDGLLPARGGVCEQSAWAIAAIDIVRMAWAKLRAAQAAKAAD